MSSDDAVHLLSQAIGSPPGSCITKQTISNTSGSPIQSAHHADTPSFLQHALQLLGAAGTGSAGVLQQRLRQLQPPMLLALLLAHQRKLGPQSFWHPYISSLPDKPPCAWYDRVEQQTRQGNSDSSGGDSSPDGAAAAAVVVGPSAFGAAVSAVAAKCSAAAALFGPALGGLGAAEVAWAYGQVASRAFATGGAGEGAGSTGLALLPVIDMLNHAAGAGVPVCVDQEGAQDQGAAGVGSNGFWCVWPELLAEWSAGEGAASISHSNVAGVVAGGVNEGGGGGDQVVLRQGEELYISYMSTCDASVAYLSFGFVPPELLS